MRIRSRALILLALCTGLALPAAGATLMASQPARGPLPLEAFFGTYAGNGVAHRHLRKVAVSQRELNVSIGPTEDGFAIAWTTVLHKGRDPKNLRVVRRDDRLAFVPSGRANLWRVAKEGDPISGETYAWTRIEGDSLITYVSWIDDEGMFDVARYTRQVTPSGMMVNFKLTREGAEVLSVHAKLHKAGQ